MGMDFLGAKRNISMGLQGWIEIYELALVGGWHPRGVVFDNWGYEFRTHSEKKRDDYFESVGSLIDNIDAGALANALEKSLPSIPDMVINDEFLPSFSLKPNSWKTFVREFIDICREGGLRIL